MQEILKVVMSAFVLFGGNRDTRKEALKGWNLKTALMIGGLPAALYCVQNMAALIAYQNLEPLTFNVLNQTKTLSAALCCYLIMGRKQSKAQMASLVVLLASALIIEKVISLTAPFVSFGGGGGVAATATQHFTQGVAPILLASFISGLAGALAQKNLQSSSGDAKGGRNPYLFNMEMNSASALILAASLLFSADGSRIRAAGFFGKWQWCVFAVLHVINQFMLTIISTHVCSYRWMDATDMDTNRNQRPWRYNCWIGHQACGGCSQGLRVDIWHTDIGAVGGSDCGHNDRTDRRRNPCRTEPVDAHRLSLQIKG